MIGRDTDKDKDDKIDKNKSSRVNIIRKVGEKRKEMKDYA
jgi:hypothetical protein